MLTDTSLYNAEGVILGFDRKAIPIEAWNGALSGRGNLWGIVRGAEIAERFDSFDEFVSMSGPVIEREHKAAGERGELRAQATITLTVIGWSGTADCARAFNLVSDANASEGGAEPYTWEPIEEWLLGPALSEGETWRLHRQGLEPVYDFDLADFDPVRHGLPIMEAQRRSLTDPRFFTGEPFHCVGGEVWATECTRTGTEQQVIHEWPDAVGQPIVAETDLDDSRLPLIPPGGFTGTAAQNWLVLYRAGRIDPRNPLKVLPVDASAAAGPMNRQQRRAAKRRAA